MIKRYKRITAVVLTVFLLAVMLPTPAFALQSRISNFSTGYELTGNGAADMVAIALAQEGKTGSQLGYSEEWCCNFVSDCAILAGQSDAIPAYAYCSGLYNAILNAGGKKTTSSPQPGDICFINWDGGSGFQHVEIVYRVEGGVIYTVGGNSGGGSSLNSRCVYTHDPLYSKYIVSILRPNYAVLDISYGSKCTSYDTYCTVRVTADTVLMSQPCDQDTDEESEALKKLSVGKEIKAYAVLENTLGELWYQVKSGDTLMYLNASDTEFVGGISDGITVSNLTAPEKLTQGSSFSVSGTVKSKGIPLIRVYGYVTNGKKDLTGETDTISASSYSLKSGAVNKGLKFASLEAGKYTFIIGAAAMGYYADSGRLRTYEVEVELYFGEFTVEAHVCQYKLAWYGETHPHYAVYKCAECGDAYTEKSQTTMVDECTDCYPEPEETSPVPLPEKNGLYPEEICFHPFFASCDRCHPGETE